MDYGEVLKHRIMEWDRMKLGCRFEIGDCFSWKHRLYCSIDQVQWILVIAIRQASLLNFHSLSSI